MKMDASGGDTRISMASKRVLAVDPKFDSAEVFEKHAESSGSSPFPATTIEEAALVVKIEERPSVTSSFLGNNSDNNFNNSSSGNRERNGGERQGAEGELELTGGKRQWTDRSLVGMDVEAASEVWQLLVRLDVEGVNGAVLNALDSLTQTLLVRSFPGREAAAGVGGATAATASPALTTAVSGASGRGSGGGSGENGGKRDINASHMNGDLRTVLLGGQAVAPDGYFILSGRNSSLWSRWVEHVCFVEEAFRTRK